MKWIKATPKDFDGRLSHKFFRDTKTKENLSAGAAFSFFKRDCIDLVEILDESLPPVQSDSDLDDIISKYVGNPSRLLRIDVEKTAVEYASLKTKELREALEEKQSEIKECEHPFKDVSQKGNNFYCHHCKGWL